MDEEIHPCGLEVSKYSSWCIILVQADQKLIKTLRIYKFNPLIYSETSIVYLEDIRWRPLVDSYWSRQETINDNCHQCQVKQCLVNIDAQIYQTYTYNTAHYTINYVQHA